MMYNNLNNTNKYSHFFLWNNYISNYKDLQDAQINTNEKAWKHFVDFGWKEDRHHAFRDLETFNDYVEFRNYNVPFKKNYKLYNESNKIVMTNVSKLEPELLSKVNDNIDTFMGHCEGYKNVLFICGDYPGYGGASTNCFKLQQFFKQKGHDTYGIFFNFPNEDNKKIIEENEHCVIEHSDIKKKIAALKELHFIPDLIILKSFTDGINFKHYFPHCTIFYLIGGIYNNTLSKPYEKLKSIQEHVVHINKHVIKQIKNSDYVFCNSAHTCDILQQIYNIETTLFYSSFVPYYRKKPVKDKHINDREYKYGLIVSNFNRKIKNITKSMQFLEDKKNVILIGKNSRQYTRENFKCLELQNMNRMDEHYKKIKYIVQDSFYESCSNVRIEALFNACKIINSESMTYLQLNLCDLKHIYTFEPDVNYILAHDTSYFNIHDIEKLFVKNTNINLYLTNNANTKDIVLMVKFNQKRTSNLVDILREATFNNDIIGNSLHKFTNQELIHFYYLLGNSQIDYKSFGLSIFYDSYVKYFENRNKNSEKIARTFNKKMFTLCYSYYLGQNNKNILNVIKMLDDEYLFHTKKCLIISKLIKGFGGVQKTSKQLIETLDEKYDIELLSCVFSKNCDYDFKTDALCNTIPHCIIVKLKKYTDVIQYINSQKYEFIVVNKLNEIFDIIKAINIKPDLLIHNPMDSMNTLLLNNSENVNKVFVINNYHRNLLKAFGVNKQIYLYNNYVFDKNINNSSVNRKEFKNSICFIGRITSEKNIELLIDAFTKFQEERKPNLKLYIIGENNARDYNLKKTKNKNIIFTGRITFEEIVKYFNECDYTISSSFTEGKPFSVIEGMSYGIPCIHSNINGIDEIIINNISGYTFNFEGYESVKYSFDFNFFNFLKKHHEKNIINLYNCLCKAYEISINDWNFMSKNCIEFCKDRFSKEYCSNKNRKMLSNSITNHDINDNKIQTKRKYLIFCSFKPDMSVAYGGGNISVYYIIRILLERFSDFEITYELCENINLYFMVDVLKDRGQFKKYGIENVIEHKLSVNPNAKILLRVNDCDITRVVNNNNSREKKIIQYYEYIDYFVYNSSFICNYYFDKFKTIDYTEKPSVIIHNGCDQDIFNFCHKQIPCQQKEKIKIVTHHWSSNINKGYETYYKLWDYFKTNNNNKYEFVFIGKNVPEMFSKVKISGPFVGNELASELNKCHIYITDSRYDSCPNHVLEAISCGLPILYSDVEGGALELCQKSPLPIGEIYSNFDELLKKIDIITNNYQFYIDNLKKYSYLYAIDACVSLYYGKIIYNICSNDKQKNDTHIKLEKRNNIIRVLNNNKHNSYITTKSINIKLSCGENIIALSNNYLDITCINCDTKSIKISEFENNEQKMNNTKFNILLCSDKSYLVGLFAVVQSIIVNVEKISELHFNFMISIDACDTFANMLSDFEQLNNICISKTVVFIDEGILDPIIVNSKCFNSGGHLLNIGNISRLLLGEFFEYEKMLYLDSDSIVQYDLYEKLKHINIEHPICAPLANRHNIDKKKNIIIKNISIINCDYDWKKLIGSIIKPDDYVYMGAPFIANCSKWGDVYKKMIKIINIHNNYDEGLFKLFTMSLQNIIFHNKTDDLNKYLNVLQDLGSMRKEWAISDLVTKDVLDWSGIYKPWYKNGLYKHIWDGYDFLKLSTGKVLIPPDKNKIETYTKVKKVEENTVKNILDQTKESLNIQNEQDGTKIQTKVNFELNKNYEVNELKIEKIEQLDISEEREAIKKREKNKKNNVEENDEEEVEEKEETEENNKESITLFNNYINNKQLKLDEHLLRDTNKYLNTFINIPKKKNYKYNICYVCDLKYMISKMSRVRFWAMEGLGNHPEIKLHMTGPGFMNFDKNKNIQQNIIDMNINFDAVFWYKPLDAEYNFNKKIKFPFKTYIRYNEMWDTEWTQKEINSSKSDVIICHHKNDYVKYCQLYANDKHKDFYYCAHHANPNIFKSLHGHKDIDILLSGVCKEKHYPLKCRLLTLLKKYKKTALAKYKIIIHQHPGYNHMDSFKNKNQIEYNNLINRSKICVACTSKHKYRLGKYVEIPMAGSLILGDIPYEDQENFRKFVLEVNLTDTDEQILSIIKYALDNYNLMQNNIAYGIQWAKNHTTERYVNDLYNIVNASCSTDKILIISDEIKKNHPEFKNQKWICDQLKDEFTNEFPEYITTDPSEATIVWYLAPWNMRYIPKGFTLTSWQKYLNEKKVIFTQHHIDETKYQSSLKKQFEYMNKYGDKLHTICELTKTVMQKYFPDKQITNYPLWIDNKVFYELSTDEKIFYRECFKLDKDAFLIGSFQKDTEGKSNMPKLSKGPDIFIKIIKNMYKTNKNIQVVLTGLRREYIIKELKALKIKYYYFNMVPLESINQLYNCLNLYISASRCEGGPRSVVECGLTKTPIISTYVGIAPELMDKKSMFDCENWESYQNAIPNSEYLHNKVLELTTHSHKRNLLNILLN